MSALNTTEAAQAVAPKKHDAPVTTYTWQCSGYFGCGQKSSTSYVALSCPSCGGNVFEHVPGG